MSFNVFIQIELDFHVKNDATKWQEIIANYPINIWAWVTSRLTTLNHPCVPPFCNLAHFDLKAIANNYAHNEGEIDSSSDCNFFVITCLVGFV
jgi:hypothetical protein